MVDSSARFVAGYSIWAVPGQPEAHALQDVIETYAKRLATSPFLPHMTVLSGVKGLTAEESTAKLTTLADSMHQLEVEIDMVAFKEDSYFQCVFGLLKLTSELSRAYDCAKQIYGVERNEKFMPHVSFIYGDLPHEMRVKLANELRPRFDGKRLKMESLVYNRRGGHMVACR